MSVPAQLHKLFLCHVGPEPGGGGGGGATLESLDSREGSSEICRNDDKNTCTHLCTMYTPLSLLSSFFCNVVPPFTHLTPLPCTPHPPSSPLVLPDMEKWETLFCKNGKTFLSSLYLFPLESQSPESPAGEIATPWEVSRIPGQRILAVFPMGA